MEAYATYCGLRLCWEMGLRDIELETDSKLVADALKGRTKRQNMASNLIHDALALASSFSFVSFSHVSRHANNVARVLAKLALSLGEEMVWLGEGPQCITDLVEQEKPCTDI